MIRELEDRWIGHRADDIDEWRPQLPQWIHHAIALLEVAAIDNRDSHHWLALEIRRDERRGRGGHYQRHRGQLVRRGGGIARIGWQDGRRLVSVVEDRAAVHHPSRMYLNLKHR